MATKWGKCPCYTEIQILVVKVIFSDKPRVSKAILLRCRSRSKNKLKGRGEVQYFLYSQYPGPNFARTKTEDDKAYQRKSISLQSCYGQLLKIFLMRAKAHSSQMELLDRSVKFRLFSHFISKYCSSSPKVAAKLWSPMTNCFL